jgi:hypothetical protein
MSHNPYERYKSTEVTQEQIQSGDITSHFLEAVKTDNSRVLSYALHEINARNTKQDFKFKLTLDLAEIPRALDAALSSELKSFVSGSPISQYKNDLTATRI